MACNHSCWLHIVKEISNLKQQGIDFMDFMRLKLGNGSNISFWNDHWIGDGSLKDLYPRLYALEDNNHATVNLKLADDRLVNSFRREPRGGEFSVASIRRVIDDKRLLNVTSKTRWIKYVPIKVNILAWKVKLDALPTRLNISRRGITIDSIICPICDTGVESSNHLFFMCNLARHLSRMITHWWDIPQVEGNSYDAWCSWLLSLRLQSEYKLILEGIFYVMWWHLWSYRNKLLFESMNPLKATIFDDIVSRSFYWCRFRCKASFSWNDWLKTPYLVSL
ncbi:RNA-directed DNA polymerase, eukaryota [Tanacetum coccineum]